MTERQRARQRVLDVLGSMGITPLGGLDGRRDSHRRAMSAQLSATLGILDNAAGGLLPEHWGAMADILLVVRHHVGDQIGDDVLSIV